MPNSEQERTHDHRRGIKIALTTLALLVFTPTYADLANFEDLVLFIDEGRLVTLTNNHQLLPTSCQLKGRVSANRKTGDTAPIDPIGAMNWYIATSRKYQANYLLTNARYETLWAYQCPG